MGALTSRNDSESEEMDSMVTNAYKYPPKSGNYFSSYFYMGGEKFDMPQPESYLFGENTDLNFLGGKPVPFPYLTPSSNEPIRPLKSLVNIRKDSLRLVKLDDSEKDPDDSSNGQVHKPRYNIEFTFDSDARCAITIYYFATEDVSSVNNNVVYTSKDSKMNSETFRYKRGTNQLFSQSTHILDPWKYPEEDWQFDPGKEDPVPIVISCVVEDEEHPVHSHITYAVMERSSADGGYIIKPLKQKQFVDGTIYLLQEIYGIENKQVDRSKLDPDDDVEDSGAECVICMSDMRDTLILPCRHLCLCSTCAESLRYQASSCPICRSPFRALLQIRAMRKKQQLPVHTGENNEENTVSQEGVPQGYEAVSLIEAVNGPCSQMFTMDGGLQFPVRIPPDVDSHREKKRSSKRQLINVKPEETVNTNVTLKPDDKKVLDEEEEERKKSSPHDPLEVVCMEQIEQNKEEMGSVGRFNKKDSTDDSTSSKIVNVSGEYSSDNTDVKDLSDQHMSVELKVYESEAESDYELKPVSLTHDQQTSTENLADDEREDTSEGEGEPEPDYDDDDDEDDDENVRKQDDVASRVRATNKRDSTLSETPPTRHNKGIVYVKDCSRSTGTLNVEGYQNLRIASSTSLPENTTSGTEGSSCGSSQGLLPDSQLTDDDK